MGAAVLWAWQQAASITQALGIPIWELAHPTPDRISVQVTKMGVGPWGGPGSWEVNMNDCTHLDRVWQSFLDQCAR